MAFVQTVRDLVDMALSLCVNVVSWVRRLTVQIAKTVYMLIYTHTAVQLLLLVHESLRGMM